MIPVPRLDATNEPPLFALNCRTPGAGWLVAHPDADPHEQSAWWAQFRPALAEHFGHRCGWLATWIGLDGVVEHWLACGPRADHSSPNRHLAFEWSNYRYAASSVNSRKGTLDDQVLDPCEVQPDWFEVLLPSFQMVATDAIPEGPLRAKANFTLEKLDLRRGFNPRWTRWNWYQRYWNGGAPDLAGLQQDAPLLAAAVAKAVAAGNALPDPTGCIPPAVITPRRRAYRARAPV